MSSSLHLLLTQGQVSVSNVVSDSVVEENTVLRNNTDALPHTVQVNTGDVLVSYTDVATGGLIEPVSCDNALESCLLSSRGVSYLYNNLMMVDLPDPEPPTIAYLAPAGTLKLRLSRIR